MRIAGLQKLTLLDFPGKTAATVFTAQDDLDAGGLGPAVDVDKEIMPMTLSVLAASS